LKCIRFVGFLGLFALIAIAGRGTVAAQSAPSIDLAGIDGLQRAVTRAYGPDMAAMMNSFATPVAPGAATPSVEDLMKNASYVSATVLQYDNGDDASSGLDKVNSSAVPALQSGFGTTFQESDLSGFGDAAKEIKGSEGQQGTMMTFEAILLRTGDFNYIVTVISQNEQADQMAREIATAMLNNHAGDGDGTFNADGTSSGGIWDILPAHDDPALGALVVFGDEIVFPAPAGTPAP
jgi:hypothetical protein